MNKRLTICLQVHDTEASAKFSVEVAKHFSSSGVTSYLWCNSEGVAKYCRDYWPHVIDFSEALSRVSTEEPWGPERLVEFMRKGGYNNLNDFFFSQAYYEKEKSNDHWLEKTRVCAQAVEHLVRMRHAIDICITYSGDEIFHNIFKLFSSANGSRMVYYTNTCYMDRIAFTTHNKGIWEVDSSRDAGDEAELYARRFLDEMWSTKVISSVYPVSAYQPSFTMFKQVKAYLTDRRKRERVNIASLRAYLREEMVSLKRKNTIKKISKHYSALTAIQGKKYFYLPLHFPYDSQLTLRAKQYLDQPSIVEIVSRYIPYPALLVVKEHPLARGFMDESNIRKMCRLDNVVLLEPQTNSHDIIPNAEAVIVLNSTVGFESICYQKRIIALAESFYRGQGLTQDIDNPADLDTILNSDEYQPIDEEKTLTFLKHCYSDSYPVGILDVFKCEPSCAQGFVESVLDYVGTRMETASTKRSN